jgi:DNA primase catalytic core
MNTAPAWSSDLLIAANEDAADFFRRNLLGSHGQGPRRYLIERGFDALLDTTRWTVGYAPAGWTHLRDHLTDLGYTDQTLIAAGLTRLSSRGTPIDCFRDRITFGIRNPDNALVGFTARCSPDAPPQTPKYLNTSSTPIYDKSRILFGVGEATTAHDHDLIAITEGPLDAIAIDLADGSDLPRFSPVALCGTAFTPRHRRVLASLHPDEILLAFDNDGAGAKATIDTYRTLRQLTNIKAIQSLAVNDVAECHRRDGPESVAEILQTAVPAIDAIIETRLATWPKQAENAEAAIACLRSISQLINDLKPHDIARQAVRLQHSTKLPTATITRELANALTR